MASEPPFTTKIPKLAIRITAAGSRTFYVVKRAESGMAWLKLGSFPDMTVENARREAEKVLGQYAQGLDPAEKNASTGIPRPSAKLSSVYILEHAIPRGVAHC